MRLATQMSTKWSVGTASDQAFNHAKFSGVASNVAVMLCPRLNLSPLSVSDNVLLLPPLAPTSRAHSHAGL